MGCGHSKINLYPRRSKHGDKRSGAKKSGAVDKDTDEEEGSAGGAAPADEIEEEPDSRQHALPISDHQPAFEVSASQQNFFKLLDEKIEQGKDYDSSSDTEIQLEQERRQMLIEQWRSVSQSTRSSSSSGPPTPVRHRVPRGAVPRSDRQCSPGPSKCFRQASEGTPPQIRRAVSAQTHHDPRLSAGDWQDPRSPAKRIHSAGPNWKNNTKVAPLPKKREDRQLKDEAVAGCSKDSQITYNPTFQNHSPAHSSKSQQPYKAQIVSYPITQQVTPPSPSKFIAPPEEYQDQEPKESASGNGQVQNSSIYYIHGNASSNAAQDLVQQRQQTALHLQHYVAMKQAQQQMFSTYMQRGQHAVYPTIEYSSNAPRMYEGEELAAQYGHPGLRPHSAPGSRPSMASYIPEVAHMQMPMWSPLPPVMTTVPWAGGQVPPEMQYYPQSQFVPMYRAHAAGSAGTLTRYKREAKEDATVCQSISIVRPKPVGQIVSAGGQELAVSTAAEDAPSPASGSTDSGVSPGASAPSCSSKGSGTSSTPSTCSGAADASQPPAEKPKKKSGAGRSLKTSKSLDA